ncbi:MAG: ABC transporter substrate-binding protein [Bacteroidota bacterium]
MTRPRLLVLLTALTVLLGACTDTSRSGTDASATPASAGGGVTESPRGENAGTATAYPLTIETCGVRSTLNGPPERILVYYGFAEPLLLWGLGDAIDALVSFDPTSSYPGMDTLYTGLTITKQQFSREVLIAMGPDLVISSSDYAFNAEAGFLTREELSDAGIATWIPESLCALDKADPTPEEAEALAARDFDEVLADLAVLGIIVDRQAEAVRLVAEMEAKMAAVEARVAGRDPVRVAIVTADRDGSRVTGVYTGGINEDIIRRAGGVNPFATPESGQYTSLSMEQLTVTPLDVLLTDIGLEPGGEALLLRQFPTWPAAKDGRIGYIPGIVGNDPGLPWAAEQLARLLYPDLGGTQEE